METQLELAIVTGMSGAGRSTAAHALEDIGFLVIDNLPPQLLAETISLVSSRGGVERLAVVTDARGGALFAALEAAIAQVRPLVKRFTLVFLEASDAALVKRFESSRRPHPLQDGDSVLTAIKKERELLVGLREQADLIVDTSDRNVHELRRTIDAAFTLGTARLRVTFTSFGFKYGLPLDADLVLDVRFLPNPFWIEELRHLTGNDEAVRRFVLAQEGAEEFIDAALGLIKQTTNGYLREGKQYLTIAVGCTGGQHRSVAVANALAERLGSAAHECFVVHRDCGKE